MAYKVIELYCPGCGARVTIDQKICSYCGKPIIVSTFNSVSSLSLPEINKYAGEYGRALGENPDDGQLNHSIALCYLKLKLYDKALQSFEKAIQNNFDNSETFFYAAVCLLEGKKPFLHQRTVIDRVLEYVNAALAIEPKGIYYYFLAYVKYDYFARKFFRISPSYQETLDLAKQCGLSEYDVNRLYDLLCVPRPSCM